MGAQESPAAVGGGASLTPTAPAATAPAVCAPSAACQPGQTLRLTGKDFSAGQLVRFAGARSPADDRRARPLTLTATELEVRVPRAATTGPVDLVTDTGSSIRIVERLVVAPAGGDAVGALPTDLFPIRARHDLGQTPTNNFGGARGHKGQDMFAACGSPIVAARGGTVTKRAFQARAGNYVVITTDTGESHVYMHMAAPSPLTQGDDVVTGEAVGKVGDTGVAEGCHLHFELWTAPGWYTGGKAVDPLPRLKAWDAQS